MLTIIRAKFLLELGGPRAQGFSNTALHNSARFKISMLVLANSLNISNIDFNYFSHLFSISISLTLNTESIFLQCSEHTSVMPMFYGDQTDLPVCFENFPVQQSLSWHLQWATFNCMFPLRFQRKAC